LRGLHTVLASSLLVTMYFFYPLGLHVALPLELGDAR
jgi:hypothetical protein